MEAYSLPNQEAATVARVLVNEWICQYGALDTIHSDQGKNFDSQLFKETCHLLGIHKTRTTPYHPQSDGLVESFNQTLKILLRIRMKQIPEDMWDDELPLLMLAYRSSVQKSTQFTPYQLMFGRELPIELMFGGRSTPVETHGDYVTHLKEWMEAVYGVVHEHLGQAARHQKQCYDRKSTGGRYQVGDTVWLYSPAVPKGRTPKFHRPWKGPYRVVKVLSDVTYHIQLMSPRNKHDRRSHCRIVVHFNHLKPCHLQENHQPGTPLPVTEIVPPLGHSNEVAPQSEHLEDEEEPWAYYQPESSPLVETDEQLESSESTFHTQDESQHDSQQTVTTHQKALEVDQSGVPDCAKKFNPQTITSLSPGRASAPKGGSNSNCVQLVYFHQCLPYSHRNCTPAFFHLHYLSCIFSNCIRAIS